MEFFDCEKEYRSLQENIDDLEEKIAIKETHPERSVLQKDLDILKNKVINIEKQCVDLKDILPLDIMMLIFKLPNVFSRRYYMKYIIDAFELDHYSTSYFTLHDNPQRAAMLHMGREYDALSHQIEWIKLCKAFLQFMSEFVFPLFERCFFVLYQDAIIDVLGGNDWM